MPIWKRSAGAGPRVTNWHILCTKPDRKVHGSKTNKELRLKHSKTAGDVTKSIQNGDTILSRSRGLMNRMTGYKGVHLTSDNLALFERIHKNWSLESRSRGKRVERDRPGGEGGNRVLDWVKTSTGATTKTPRIIPIKQSKTVTSSVDFPGISSAPALNGNPPSK